MPSLSPSEVIYGMKLLTSPDIQTNLQVKQPSKDSTPVSSLDLLLQRNIKSFDDALTNDAKLASLSKWWGEIKLFETIVVSSIRWKFVSHCLKILKALQQSLQLETESKDKELVTESQHVKDTLIADGNKCRSFDSPKLAAPALGVQDQKSVKTVLQFIVCLGICPCLQTGVGIPLHMRSGFSSVVGSTSESPVAHQVCLYTCLNVLLQCIEVTSLGTLILSQHLTDVLAGLLQVIYVSKSERNKIEHKTTWSEITTDISDHCLTDRAENVKVSDKVSNTNDYEEHVQCKKTVKINEFSSVNKPKHSVSPEAGVSPVKDESSTETINIMINSENTSKEGPVKGVSVDREHCEKSLKDLLERVYPPLLVKTLLLLQGGPKLKKPSASKMPMLPPAPVWLRRIINCQLTTIMMRPKGVQYVLRGMLDGPGASTGINTGTADWKRCDAVAKVIACCPLQSVTMEEFYKSIGPQITGLIHLEDKQLCQQYIRIACSTMSNMAHQNMALTRQYVIIPLIEPLLSCTWNQDDNPTSKVIVTESALNACVEACYKVFVCGCADNPSLITSLQPVILTVFSLLVFTKPGVSTLKKQCHEIVVSFLKQTDRDVGMTCLDLMAFQDSRQEVTMEVPRMHSDLSFLYGPNGGVQVVVTRGNGDKSTEDDSMRVECIVSIMKDLESSGLAGEFFVYMLKELTGVIQSEVKATGKSYKHNTDTDSSLLLNQELEQMERVEQFYRKIMLLNVLASVCEVLGPDCIQNATHALEFVKATLERGVQVCKATDDLMTEVFESETLSMAMGLLTATLTGAYKLTEENRTFMNELLPLLQEVSSNHPESSVQEMATDIRIAIATHGAVWSDKTRSKTKDFSRVAEKIGKETQKANVSKFNEEKTSRPVKPKIEVIHECPNKDIAKSKPELDIANTKSVEKQVIAKDSSEKLVSSDRKLDGLVQDVDDTHDTRTTEASGKPVYMKDSSVKYSSNGFQPNQQISDNDKADDNNPPKHIRKAVSIEDCSSQGLIEANKDNAINTSDDTGNNKSVVTKETPQTELDQRLNEANTDNTSDGTDKDKSVVTKETAQSELDQVYEELCDPLLPVRGHGLIRLTRMIRRRDREVIDSQGAVLTIFLENLDHADSYLYLASVAGLTALCDLCPDLVVPKLCEMFANFDMLGKKEGIKRKAELRMKIGEVLVKASRCLGDTIPKYRDMLIQSFMVGTKDSDPFVRASSLSNIGEICKLLRFSLGNIIQEVFQCCNSLLRYDDAKEVRKAAGQAITLLLQGMTGDSIKVLEGVIKDLYRMLKQCMITEKEQGVKVHVTMALNELDDIMRKQLFPTQKLEKRIRVLDFD